MKKTGRLLVIAVVILITVASLQVTAVFFERGDANGDQVINQQDTEAVWEELAEQEEYEGTLEGNPDANGDGIVNLKDVTYLQRMLSENENTPETDTFLADDLKMYEILSSQKSECGIICTSFLYGKSVMDRELICWNVSPATFDRTVLLNFAIHGWEDSYAADGQLLVNLGNALVKHYAQSEELKNCRLLIIPCANPDGIAEGTTNNGFGRCNADGIDLNRDFDASHIVYTNARNYTPAPFSGLESQALRDLVLASNPDVVVDFHGWLNYTIGNSALAEVFSTYIGVNHKYELTTGAHGYFSYWAQLQGAEAILVEFKDTTSIVTEDVILAVDQLIADNYGSKQHNYLLDEAFVPFDTIVAYALGTGRVYTQKQVGDTGTEYGYIVGGADECTVLQIYSNGWCKVNYPVGELTKTGYCELSAFIPEDAAIKHYTSYTSGNTPVYSSPEFSEQIGSVWSTDVITVVAEKDGLAQIIYPLDIGGYKMGWINANAIQPQQ